jgi:peptidoglycan/xylan/chitin deacetylase (PgdA/CDA1 family)
MGIKYVFLRFPEGKAKAVTLSYDDGCVNDPRLLETINKYGLKCTFNLVGKNVDAGTPLSVEFIKENILACGHEVATHGYYHRAQNKIRPVSGIRDTLDCRIALERAFGIIIRGMAFPDCSVNRFLQPDIYEKVKGYISDLEIAYIRTAGGDNDSFVLPDDWYNWMPTAHHDNPKVMEYIDSFVSLDVSNRYIASRDPRLFYLWGHAFEFERKNNWDHLEEICQRLGGKDDIWYATNIEIHDYVEAYKQLIYSADETMVYNPTLFDIWLDVDKKLYLIRSGETITIN